MAKEKIDPEKQELILLICELFNYADEFMPYEDFHESEIIAEAKRKIEEYGSHGYTVL